MHNSREHRKAFLSKLRSTNPIANLIRKGVTPDQIHEFVLCTLRPHFSNQEQMEHYALSFLVPYAINLLRVQKRAVAWTVFQRCIEIHKQAFQKKPKAAAQALHQFEPDVINAVSQLWTTSNLERDASAFPIHEFTTEIFRLIGALLEASVQPFLRLLVVQVRIARSKPWLVTGIRDLSLGNLVDELASTAGIGDLVAPPPWGVRLNQWRNIAQHHLARIDGEEIVLSAEAAKRPTDIRLSRADALSVCRELIGIYTAVKCATDIVIFDRTTQPPCFDVRHGIREEALLLHFSAAISTQGFELMDLIIDDTSVRAEFGELTGDCSVQRASHASQLLALLFWMVPRPKLEINYIQRDGVLYASISGKGQDFEAANHGLLTAQELSTRTVVRFTNDDELRL